MNKTKRKITFHSEQRMEERAGVLDFNTKRQMSAQAAKTGMPYGIVPKGPFYDYLEKRAKSKGKKVKIHAGYVFIFNKNSDMCITMYPVPDEFMEEYKKVKDAYRASRRGKK